MIDVDKQASAQLRQRRTNRSRRDAAYRMAAVEASLTAPKLSDHYAKCGVSGSTFYFWRCEYVLRQHVESLESQLVALRAEVDAIRARRGAPGVQPASRVDRRLDALERRLEVLACP